MKAAVSEMPNAVVAHSLETFPAHAGGVSAEEVAADPCGR
jgi:hypothetical protein